MRGVILKLAPVGPGDLNVGEDGSVDFVSQIDEFVGAGISIVRLKATDSEGKYAPDLSKFGRLAVWVRERANVLLEVPSEAGIDVLPEERVEPLLLNPNLVSIMPGSTNAGEDVFYNPADYLDFILQYCENSGFRPVFTITNSGMLKRAISFLSMHETVSPPFLFNVIFGGEDFLPASPKSLLFIKDLLPQKSEWFATVKGDLNSAFILLVASLGGNIIVGREFNLSFDGQAVDSNIELVKGVRRILELAGYRISTVQESVDTLKI